METNSPTANTTTSKLDTSAAVEHARRSIDEARASAAELTASGSDALRNSTARVREAFNTTTDQTAQYVQAQPLKSLLMALTAGAAIALLAGLVGRRNSGS